jgi:hypothetical protein
MKAQSVGIFMLAHILYIISLSPCVRLSVCDHWTQRKVMGKLDAGEK